MSTPVESALVIGRRIVDDAIWSDARCTWIGATTIPGERRRGAAPVAVPLGPDLYEGTAGVALFLAHLHALTGDAAAAGAARGALRLAIEKATPARDHRPGGLYAGALGVAVAAALCGRLLDDEGLRRAAPGLVPHRRADPPGDHGIISGAAGTIVGLLVLAEELDEVRFREDAIRRGRLLEVEAGRMPLTGMAHGEAGLVHAFAELRRAGADGFGSAVRRASAGEGRHFDRATGNWADLRPPPTAGPGQGRARSAMAWCHGAPGILLSRRRSLHVVDAAERARLSEASRTVRDWIRAAVETRPGDLSLCHGLTGNAEALVDATGRPAATELAIEVAAHVGDSLRQGEPLRCGTPAGETPSLMLGTAGIGLFCLRLVDPSIPSVLAIAPAAGGAGRVTRDSMRSLRST